MSGPSASRKRVALITGANKETACHIALLLGQEHGMTVLAGEADEQTGRAAAARLAAQGIDVRPVVLDVANPASIEAAARRIGEEFGGGLDVLINHADMVLDGSLPGHGEPATFKATFEANVHTPFQVSAAMLPLLERSGAGRIVNVSGGLDSAAQHEDPPGEFAPYRVFCHNSSRAALHMQTALFAAELVRAGASVKVNAADLGSAPGTPAGHRGPRTIEPGVRAVVRLATLPADGPSGDWFAADRPLRS